MTIVAMKELYEAKPFRPFVLHLSDGRKIPVQHRAAVMAAFYVVAYGSLSVPAVLAGVVVTHISLQSTFEIFGSVVAAIGLVVAFEAWRQRPGSHRHSTEPKEAPLEQAS